MTFKQLEALFWIAHLGGFGPAAQKLHTTQSAISKRVHDLESLFETQLFDRTQRTARLTEKGEEMFVLARRLLEQRDAAIEQFGKPEVIERRMRIGVTELTALTWLHHLVEMIQSQYPKVIIEPDVDASVNLREKLLAEDLDIVFVPNAFAETRLQTKPIGKTSSVWMCKPGYVEPGKVFQLHELVAHRLLVQGGRRSGAGMLHSDWMKSQGVQPTNTIVFNNLLAMIGLTVAGLGIGYLPEKCLGPMVKSGLLAVVPCTPAQPAVTYVALYRGDIRSTLISSIVVFAQKCCDFKQMIRLGS